MTIRLDLHVHSQRSADGCMSISEIVAQARKRGLQGIAICDHDIAVETVPQYDDFLIIPGIEVSTDRGHVLGLFITEQISTNQLDEAVHSMHAQGGLAVIAHPFEHSQDIHRLDDAIEQLDGIEVWNGRADRKNKQANAMALELAKHWNKPVTAGSDAHIPEEIGNGAVILEVDALHLESVRQALLQGANQVQGKRGRSMCVAKSQLQKRRRTNAHASAYGKWALFAAKCFAEDCLTRKEKTHVIDCKTR